MVDNRGGAGNGHSKQLAIQQASDYKMADWSKEQIEQTLNEKAWFRDVREIQSGIQFILSDGTRVNLYTTGKVLVQGQDTDIQREAKEIFSGQPPPTIVGKSSASAFLPQPSESSLPNRVFIVYGHDLKARNELELILRRLKLEPIVLQNLSSAGDTLIEKLETFTDADFACVLLTPDDKGHPVGKPEMAKFRARQNVVLELGMVLARLGRSQVAILVKDEELERPSDIEGLIYIPFKESVDETKNHLAANLQKAGFAIQVADLL